jgi:hypothetical protein
VIEVTFGPEPVEVQQGQTFRIEFQQTLHADGSVTTLPIGYSVTPELWGDWRWQD